MAQTAVPPLPPVPRLTKSGFEDPVWMRWFNQLRTRVAVLSSGVSVASANGFTSSQTVDPTTGQIVLTMALQPTATGMLKGSAGQLVPAVAGVDFMPGLGYADFDETSTRTAAANTPTGMTWEIAAHTQSFNVGTPTTRLVCTARGRYNVQFSLQFDNSATSADDVVVWVRKNGVDLADSAGLVTIPPKHGSLNGATISGWNLLIDCLVGDYLELFWLTVAGTSRIVTYPASTTPPYPRSPGAIISLTQVAVI